MKSPADDIVSAQFRTHRRIVLLLLLVFVYLGSFYITTPASFSTSSQSSIFYFRNVPAHNAAPHSLKWKRSKKKKNAQKQKLTAANRKCSLVFTYVSSHCWICLSMIITIMAVLSWYMIIAIHSMDEACTQTSIFPAK